MNVLSLFDGMSCGQVALERAGIKVGNYFASEVDKYAISVTQKNYPNTIQLGDVTKWREWELPEIDLVIGGSPCQGFSFAGKQLNFDDPRSKLFFEFHNILKAVKPKYFLLENVKMKKESMDVITNLLEVEPIKINSALVSAQNRERLYWTNIPGVEQPGDKGILLKDIIEDGFVDRDKSYCLDANYFKGGNLKQYFDKSRRQLVFGAAMRGRYDENGKVKQQIELRKDGKSNALTTVQKDSLCIQVGEADLKGYDIIKQVYSVEGKAPTLTTMGGGHREPKIALNELQWRKLTPLECERLQTLPDGYTEGVSNTQRYKMIGNGWTVDVIAHIFKNLKEENHGTK
jgi:DNA-cytosine methyltransferase